MTWNLSRERVTNFRFFVTGPSFSQASPKEAFGEAFDVKSEVYCRRRSGIFWRMRASLGLACAQAATLGTQVIGRPRLQEMPVEESRKHMEEMALEARRRDALGWDGEG